MNKKIITACAAALLMAACAGAWLAYHHANPKTDRLEFEYGDPLDIEAETLIRSPDPAIADTVEIDLSAIEREEDGTAAAGSWDASFTYTDVFGTHTCLLTICISDTAAPSFLKLPERITLAPGNADHDFSADIEIWDLSECRLEIDSSMVDFDQPGEYILFATAVDRYDNQRSRSIRLTISEAQDTPAFIASSETVTDIDPVLQRMIEAYLSAHAGDQEHWSIMVMDAESAAAIVSVNSAVQQSASLMKLFVMGAVYDRYDSLSAFWGSAAIDDLLERMITVSDSDAWIELVTMLGGGDYGIGCSELSAWCRSHGYPDTAMYPDYYQNFTSVSDTCHFLQDVCQGALPHADDMLALLKQQQFTWKIPAGVPDDVVTANKTGELSDTENDAAIIFAPKGTYILSVMSTSLQDRNNAQQMIRELSAMIYDYLNA